MPPKRLASNLQSAKGVVHGFFGRTGGVSTGIFESLNCGPGSADPHENVIENRRRAADALASDAQLVTLYQVHGERVVRVETPWDIANAPQADALLTNVPGIGLGILAADCAPILLADAVARVIGAAHGGWKGARAGVIESVVSAMEGLGAKRDRIVAAIGPCISQASYEVGQDLHDGFVRHSQNAARFFLPGARANHFQFDLEAYVVARLAEAGVGSIERLSVCTYANDSEFFSYRRATHRGETDYGRQISAILLCK